MTTLTLPQAQKIIEAALARSKERGYQPMGIAVLDAAGNLKAFASEDGASMFRFDIARAKAWGAVGMGVSSRTLAQRAQDNPNFFLSLAATAEGKPMVSMSRTSTRPARACRAAPTSAATAEIARLVAAPTAGEPSQYTRIGRRSCPNTRPTDEPR